jgi:hypothetical protein
VAARWSAGGRRLRLFSRGRNVQRDRDALRAVVGEPAEPAPPHRPARPTLGEAIGRYVTRRVAGGVDPDAAAAEAPEAVGWKTDAILREWRRWRDVPDTPKRSPPPRRFGHELTDGRDVVLTEDQLRGGDHELDAEDVTIARVVEITPETRRRRDGPTQGPTTDAEPKNMP